MEIRHLGPLKQLNQTGDQAFEQLFKTHFKGLHAYACTILRDSDLAEEIVQIVFVKLYERAEKISIETSLEAYLYRSVYHESLNHRKHQRVRSEYRRFALHHMNKSSSSGENSGYRELEARLHQALTELPQQCRTIFQLSRFEGLKYQEIAHRLGLSVKTVENQMGKALRVLRLKLIPYLSLMILFLLNS
jgi:RNA polymerase sigma-70 factor, ECF subfamily